MLKREEKLPKPPSGKILQGIIYILLYFTRFDVILVSVYVVRVSFSSLPRYIDRYVELLCVCLLCVDN